jgi:hypothetical protein
MAEAPRAWPYRLRPGELAERIFDVRWAATVAEQALLRLEECSRGRRRVFDVLSSADQCGRMFPKSWDANWGLGQPDQTALTSTPAALSAAARKVPDGQKPGDVTLNCTTSSRPWPRGRRPGTREPGTAIRKARAP